MNPKLAVVIPYYQRQPGLLDACVRSVLAQQAALELSVIVVDDQSPLPAEVALQALRDERLRVIVQANAGPGAARNRGIEAIQPGTEYIAFIDSDDVWEAGHLQRLMRAFEAGCDMVFANSRRYDHKGSRFSWDARHAYQLRADEHEALGDEVYAFRGDFFDFAVHRSAVISTSTLAYRYAAMPALRFNTALFNGQDRYFKLQCSQLARRVGFCTAVGATEGRGENIFDSSSWGNEKGLRLLYSYVRLPKLILETLSLSPSQRAFVEQQRAKARQSVVSTSLHLLRAGKRVDWRLLGLTLRADPLILLQLPLLLLRALRKRQRAKDAT